MGGKNGGGEGGGRTHETHQTAPSCLQMVSLLKGRLRGMDFLTLAKFQQACGFHLRRRRF